MALLRLDVPSLLLYGGSIAPGRFEGRDVTIQDVFEAVGAHAAGKLPLARLKELEDVACPGSGACGGQYTANTMALAMEVLGLSPPGYATIPAEDPRKDEATRAAGAQLVRLLRENRRPSDVVDRVSFDNAIAAVAATGGSTNAVLHLLALAREAGVPLTIDDFDAVSRRTPLIADLKPGGKYTAVDLDRAGGVALVIQRLLEDGCLDGRARAADGKPWNEPAGDVTETPGQEVVRPAGQPIRTTGGLVILRGNLAPEGCVVKMTGHERSFHRGPGGRGSRRVRGAPHRRPLQRRHPRPDGRPRRPRGGGRGPDRRASRRRFDRHRRRAAEAGGGAVARRAGVPHARLGAQKGPLQLGRVRQVRRPRLLGRRRRGHAGSRKQQSHTRRSEGSERWPPSTRIRMQPSTWSAPARSR